MKPNEDNKFKFKSRQTFIIKYRLTCFSLKIVCAIKFNEHYIGQNARLRFIDNKYESPVQGRHNLVDT